MHSAVLGLLMLSVVTSTVFPSAGYAAGVLTLASGGVGLALVSRGQRIVALVLVVIGTTGIVSAGVLGSPITTDALLRVNQDLVAMLAGISFLRLLRLTAPSRETRLAGLPALAQTALATHLFGSVINMSAVALVAERLSRNGRLRLAEGMLVSRSYAAGAFWSPFWVASAAASVYVHGADLRLVGILGLGVAVVALLASLPQVARALGDDLRSYRGYVLSWSQLRVPLLLVAVVVALHGAAPLVPVPRLVLVGAVAVAALDLIRAGRSRDLLTHATTGLSQVKAETTLFASAGVLTVGLASVLRLVEVRLPLEGYTPPVAWGGAALMVLLAVLGVHPVISIAVVAALVAELEPDPTLFLLAATLGWGSATAVGSTTGLSMYLASGFGVDPRRLIARNLHFVAIVLVLALPMLILLAALRGDPIW